MQLMKVAVSRRLRPLVFAAGAGLVLLGPSTGLADVSGGAGGTQYTTAQLQQVVNEAYAKFLEHSKTTHPLGRVGEPEEVADLIYFLASPRAGWITGISCPMGPLTILLR